MFYMNVYQRLALTVGLSVLVILLALAVGG